MITDRYPPEARSAATLFEEMAEALAKRNHDVCVLTKMPIDYVPPDRSDLGERRLNTVEYRGGVKIIRVRGMSSLSRSILIRAVEQIVLAFIFLMSTRRCGERDVSIVYSPPLPLALAAAFLHRVQGIPYVLNLHDLYPRTAVQLGVLKNRLLIWGAKLLEKLAYEKAAQIIVPAPGSQQILVKENGINATRLHLIPNWVDTKAVIPGPKENGFRKKHGLSGAFVVSYAGVMGFAQDLTAVVECARLMRERRNCIFLLVGDGVYLGRWRALATGLSNVRFLPPVAKEQYFDLLRASDVCLVPLTGALSSPAIPGKIQSIMAVSRPIVAIVPSSGDAARVVKESRSGWVIAPGDAEALKGVFEQAMTDVNLCEELGKNGRAFAEKHFGIEQAVDRYEAVLDMAQRGHGCGSRTG